MNLTSRFHFLPQLAIAVVAVVCILLNTQFRKWEKEDAVIEHDVHIYYGYLPAYFIFDDIKVVKSDYQYAENGHFFWTVETPDGKRVFKMTMGLAILYSPFFAVAHYYALHSDYPANGFSEPYKMMLLMATVFYLVMGLWLVRMLLLRLGFSATTTAITLLLTGLGTNLLAYSTWMAPMPHAFNFFLFAALAWLSLQWLNQKTFLTYLGIGIVVGLITLVRPSNAVVLICCLVLWGRSVFEKKSILNFALISLPTILLIWLPQLIYWKTVTGSYLCYSYAEEGFNFLDPQIASGLFGFRKGWFIYTPLMLFAFVGMILMRNHLTRWRNAILIFQLVNTYVILSWWCWWYGGTIGHRAFIESYAWMVVPLATFVQFVSDSKIKIRIPSIILALFFIWLNIFQIFQYDRKSLHFDSMSRTLYFKQFGKLEPIKDFNNHLQPAIYPVHKKSKIMKSKIFETITLQSGEGQFFTCLDIEPWLVTATAAKEDSTTLLKLVTLDNGKIAIKSYQEKLFSAELDKGDFLTATRTSIGGWETFSMEILDSKTIAIKGSNGKYLSIDPATGKIYANKESITNNERFTITYK